LRAMASTKLPIAIAFFLGLTFLFVAVRIDGQTAAPKKVASAQQPATARKPVEPPPTWLTCQVEYSKLADKAQVYVGGGDDVYAQSFGGGMQSIVIVKGDDGVERGYLAGESKSSEGAWVLLVHCNFKNTSGSQQVFHPIDVDLADKAGGLMAFGSASSYPFAKDEATWARLKKKVVWKFDPDKTPEATYVFLVLKGATSWKLMYHQVQIAEITPDKK
jgi:hypothetical protein